MELVTQSGKYQTTQFTSSSFCGSLPSPAIRFSRVSAHVLYNITALSPRKIKIDYCILLGNILSFEASTWISCFNCSPLANRLLITLKASTVAYGCPVKGSLYFAGFPVIMHNFGLNTGLEGYWIAAGNSSVSVKVIIVPNSWLERYLIVGPVNGFFGACRVLSLECSRS